MVFLRSSCKWCYIHDIKVKIHREAFQIHELLIIKPKWYKIWLIVLRGKDWLVIKQWANIEVGVLVFVVLW